MKHILFTRWDKGVSICTPSKELFKRMTVGGYEGGKPQAFIDRQVYLQSLAGINVDHAARYAKAITWGGIPEREVYEIVRDRDCARHGTLHDLIDTEEIPFDRWFRNAWRRSSNGGPIVIGLEEAKDAHYEKVVIAVETENRLRKLSRKRPAPFVLDEEIENRIDNAEDIPELRRIWPEGLSACSPLSRLS